MAITPARIRRGVTQSFHVGSGFVGAAASRPSLSPSFACHDARFERGPAEPIDVWRGRLLSLKQTVATLSIRGRRSLAIHGHPARRAAPSPISERPLPPGESLSGGPRVARRTRVYL
jgi:hypothetical protein